MIHGVVELVRGIVGGGRRGAAVSSAGAAAVTTGMTGAAGSFSSANAGTIRCHLFKSRAVLVAYPV